MRAWHGRCTFSMGNHNTQLQLQLQLWIKLTVIIVLSFLTFCKSFVIFLFLGISFESVYKKHCKVLPSPARSLSDTDTNTDRQQQNNNWLYCGYCNVQCKTPADLVLHCKQDRHKYAVFADCGRDVFWQFEPPPPLNNLHISAARYG